MTQLLEQALSKVRSLPPERQDEIAEVVEQMATTHSDYTAEQTDKIKRGLAQADAGDFVSDAQVETFFAQYRNV
ncbi:MAG: hypothetical protein DHS20C01_21960 [marine bacterium B5-7]|nr:MAG: hypothetical protein DHS20C01_21960 [marine bacterium B5-7]